MSLTIISTNDTAKLIRKELKAAFKKDFPKTKFSVRSSKYAGGSSITVRYTDGPAYDKVNEIVSQFAGSSFDGMTDSSTSIVHEDKEGKRYTYSPDFIFCNRDYSETAKRLTKEYVFKKYKVVDETGEEVDGSYDGPSYNLYIGATWSQQFTAKVREILGNMDLDKIKQN